MSEQTFGNDASADCAELVAENAALRDRLLRALADAENTRRRADGAAADARRYAISDFARELLTVADNLQRALEAAGAHTRRNEGTLIEGVEATQRLLAAALARFGVQRIDALGQRFDPNLHEAVTTQHSDDPPGTVIGVIEDGYTINDRLLRPARVVVAKARPDAAAPSIAPESPNQSQVNERQT
jgi:molecular chaperone GrpE